jgi:LysR family nitrogen assimilation transcriptional regulator
MELRQLSYFLTILQSGSLSKASATLGVAQPALSRQIRQLEEELGLQLLYRHGRGIRPTEEGAQFASTVEPLVRDLLQAKSEIKESLGNPAGEIRFGVPPSLSAAIGAPLIRGFMTRFPQVKLHVIDGFSGFVNEWLTNGRVDMAVLNTARRSPYIRMDPLLTVDLFLLGPCKAVEALSGPGETCPMAALNGVPLLLPGRHHGLRRAVDAAAQKLGFDANTIVEVDSLATIRELVRQGIGMTVLPQGAILAELRDSAFAVRRLVEPDVTQSFLIAFSLQRPTTMAMRELARAVRHEVKVAIDEGRMAGRLPVQEAPPVPA